MSLPFKLNNEVWNMAVTEHDKEKKKSTFIGPSVNTDPRAVSLCENCESNILLFWLFLCILSFVLWVPLLEQSLNLSFIFHDIAKYSPD